MNARVHLKRALRQSPWSWRSFAWNAVANLERDLPEEHELWEVLLQGKKINDRGKQKGWFAFWYGLCCHEKQTNLPGHMVVLIARSRIQKATLAKIIEAVWWAEEVREKNKAVMSLAKAKDNIPTTVRMTPARMNGRRRPQWWVQRSLRVPTIGAIMRPESGPATHTTWLMILPDLRPFSK